MIDRRSTAPDPITLCAMAAVHHLSMKKSAAKLTAKFFKFRPLGRRVLLRRVNDEAVNSMKGEIFIPSGAVQTNAPILQEATVLAHGPKVLHVCIGDKVLISRHADHPTIQLNGQTLSVLPEEALQVILGYSE